MKIVARGILLSPPTISTLLYIIRAFLGSDANHFSLQQLSHSSSHDPSSLSSFVLSLPTRLIVFSLLSVLQQAFCFVVYTVLLVCGISSRPPPSNSSPYYICARFTSRISNQFDHFQHDVLLSIPGHSLQNLQQIRSEDKFTKQTDGNQRSIQLQRRAHSQLPWIQRGRYLTHARESHRVYGSRRRWPL